MLTGGTRHSTGNSKKQCSFENFGAMNRKEFNIFLPSKYESRISYEKFCFIIDLQEI
jgi:hypothetical protein